MTGRRDCSGKAWAARQLRHTLFGDDGAKGQVPLPARGAKLKVLWLLAVLLVWVSDDPAQDDGVE